MLFYAVYVREADPPLPAENQNRTKKLPQNILFRQSRKRYWSFWLNRWRMLRSGRKIDGESRENRRRDTLFSNWHGAPHSVAYLAYSAG